YLRAHRSNHGRSDRQLCDAWRPEHRRAGRPDRLRRTARNRTNDTAEAAGGVPALRIPAGAWVPGRHRTSQRPERLYRRVLRLLPPLAPMNYGDSVRYLLTLGRELASPQQARAAKYDLHNISAICDRMGHPERAYASAHIAGTNGKGSTAAMLASVLQAA